MVRAVYLVALIVPTSSWHLPAAPKVRAVVHKPESKCITSLSAHFGPGSGVVEGHEPLVDERGSCGVGFVAAPARPGSHCVITRALGALGEFTQDPLPIHSPIPPQLPPHHSIISSPFSFQDAWSTEELALLIT